MYLCMHACMDVIVIYSSVAVMHLSMSMVVVELWWDNSRVL